MGTRSHKDKLLEFIENDIKWNDLMVDVAELSDHPNKQEKIKIFEAKKAQARDIKKFVEESL